MEYYAIINKKREGPFTVDELKIKGINRRTLVWHTGLPDWVPAESVKELAEFLKETLPPMPTPGAPVPPPVNDINPPKSWLGWAIFATVFGVFFYTVFGVFFYIIGAIPGIIGIVQSTTAQNRYNEGDYIGARRAEGMAKAWTIVGLCIAGVSVIIFFLFFISAINTYHHIPFD